MNDQIDREETIRFSIRFSIAEMMHWGEFDFSLIASGLKNGRPNWEIEHDEGGPRFAFAAFDGDDIHDLHMVEQ